MQIKYSPQRSDEKIEYTFGIDVITAILNGRSDTFDFTSIPDGNLEKIETTLPLNPIVSAERINGELKVELLYYHGANATQDELFPQWQVI